ncbi:MULTISPECIES: DUF58 domain-containing protein [Cupriavidus]|uniref:Uncharacterized protein n=1 Tax=Cupriavidus pinatubonensis (strain JMP 134 / LMG 1197) TaxID=264198 RepID=Q46PM3_CUPPJ|nr:MULTISPECIES: DUF58 domain-containing protein [Cupriavidus]QYY29686.1 DUF58 domain-containing protein [Cupriavidus pinatubonensis]TPQ38844.1 DUF58 domain-containing protein [Cupriavidus pinatubonensis]
MPRDPSAATRHAALPLAGASPYRRRWFRAPQVQAQSDVRLDRRRLYILPTRSGVGFAVLLLAMLLTSLNYNISLGFGLTFLLAGIGMACMWLAYRNLLDVSVTADPGAPAQEAFAGLNAGFALRLSNADEQARIGIEARVAAMPEVETASVTLDAASSGTLTLYVPAARRGWLRLPRVTLSSRFPFGLFRVWGYADLGLSVLVFPAPETAAPPLPPLAAVDNGDDGTAGGPATDGGIDQLRKYRSGDPLHRIAWKHSARTGRWMSRAGEPPARPTRWLDWHTLPASMPTEARLSRLCAWLLALSDTTEVGLRLPGVEIRPGHGAGHRRACLEALALWRAPGRGAPT